MDEFQALWEQIAQRERAEKVQRFRQLNAVAPKGQIVLAGSSLMEQFPINELLQSHRLGLHVYNRGISGDTTHGLLANLGPCILDLEPAKLFLNIGSNDIGAPDYHEDALMERYERILARVQERCPSTQIFLLAYYPVNAQKQGVPEADRASMFATRNNASLRAANRRLEALAQRGGLGYIDLHSPLLDAEGSLRAELTLEGIHLWPEAYRIVLDVLLPYFGAP